MPNSDIEERSVRKLELILVFILVQFMRTHLLFPYCENSIQLMHYFDVHRKRMHQLFCYMTLSFFS